MTKIGQIWKCNICGNIIEVLHEGADSLVCCGQPMNLMTANTIDASKEKHVPVIEGNTVKIGSEPHPMTDEHFIEWIEATSADKNICKIFLSSGTQPQAEFPFTPITARAYCNLHGLWKA